MWKPAPRLAYILVLVFFYFSVGWISSHFSEYFLLSRVLVQLYTSQFTVISHFFSWVQLVGTLQRTVVQLVGTLQRTVGLFQLSFPPMSQTSQLRHWFVDCKNISANNQCHFHFAVFNPCKLVISFITFIHIVCCLKIHLHQTMQTPDHSKISEIWNLSLKMLTWHLCWRVGVVKPRLSSQGLSVKKMSFFFRSRNPGRPVASP